MYKQSIKIYVFADWIGLNEPKLIGTLNAEHIRGNKSFSFEYNKQWLASDNRFLLDPDLDFFSGPQYPYNKDNFGVFLDSMPDTWGRMLMRRRAAQEAKLNKEPILTLSDVDYLLGVYDECRLGALRFKIDLDGSFLDNTNCFPTPPWSSIRELQHASEVVESTSSIDEIKDYLAILLAPGSSLGGARPKANIIDENDNLWIAKFPSVNDEIDKAAWEYLAYLMAQQCGIEMSESKIEKISGKHHTFFTKRFDRKGNQRIHFASAMAMLGYTEEILRDSTASYLEIAEFIKNNTDSNNIDLEQLWRRIVFHIAISNTDDHLRNHGFLIKDSQWRISPAFDINPSVQKDGLAVNIDMYDNSLNFELAKTVGQYFLLDNVKMNEILTEVSDVVCNWKSIANQIGIHRIQQELMEKAFRIPILY